MKTSIVIYRDLNGIKVRQDSKTSFFNANDLLELYNNNSGENKRLQDFLDNEKTKEFKDAIIADNLIHAKSGELEIRSMFSKRGKYGGTWMHPYLFLDFAMWLSVDFKVTAIKWIYDNIIKFRIECGDSFKEVNQALFEIKPQRPAYEYSNEARMINKLVFGKQEKNQRNNATEKQLELLKILQKIDISLIKKGLEYFERYDKLKELSDNYK